MATSFFDPFTRLITGKSSSDGPEGKPDTPASDVDRSRANLAALKGTGSADRTAQRGNRESKAQAKLKEIQLAETLEKLYEPKNFKPVGKLYFNVRYGTTGWEGFLLTHEEEETIAASFAMLTEALWLWDPRLLALIIAGGNIGSIVAHKEIRYHNMMKAARNGNQPTAPNGA